jgi:hypothetical protein
MKMKKAATLLILIGLGVSGCGTLGEQSAGPRDLLVGWYKLPDRHWRSREVIPGPGTLIPVFKRDGAYYSVSNGVEIPLKECSEGLEWALTPSSMEGTTIGFDEESNQYYITIVDRRAQYPADYSTSGEKQTMMRINKPSWLLNATVQPPRTNDDFLGCYQPLWFPVFRLIIVKDGDKYQGKAQFFENGGWKMQEGEFAELTPLTDTLGFVVGREKEQRLVYNSGLSRFEYQLNALSMPLARLDSSLPPGTEDAPPTMRIGIPSWH